jgi:hypothetical protein
VVALGGNVDERCGQGDDVRRQVEGWHATTVAT